MRISIMVRVWQLHYGSRSIEPNLETYDDWDIHNKLRKATVGSSGKTGSVLSGLYITSLILLQWRLIFFWLRKTVPTDCLRVMIRRRTGAKSIQILRNSSLMMNRTNSLTRLIAFVFLMCLHQLAFSAPVIIPAPPQVAAKAYLLLDATTGEILIEGNIDEQLPPASLTKMMTAYVVSDEIQRGKLSESDTVLISDDAWKRGGAKSGSSTMFLSPRTEVPVLDLLKGVIIQSGNDASIALAQHLAGSEAAFADVMNQYAQILGMNSTHFKNATGWPSDGHLTTARDLATLARAVINDHPEHYSLYAEKYFSYNGINQPNRNRLLHRDSSVDGLKTGHTDAAGYCLVASAKKEGMRLISVVLGARSDEARAIESQKLLAYGFRYFQTHSLYNAGQELTTSRVWKGQQDQISLGLADDVVITIPRGAKDKLKAEMLIDTQIEAPISAGQVLGELVVTLEDKEIYKENLVALAEVKQSGFFSRLWDSVVIFINGLFA